ncbi:hypothetical protein [Micromonospora sp. U21]|uniref:hypothetical protein n=1 Tax=Micromonospora sp. U21 TaxID=2824899 RepID=UPI001B383115|nr:hypothetical protein [Micromonospora sp. U21]MBQ0905268.1 hypothetical protein [Micromonospora sp. U21]
MTAFAAVCRAMDLGVHERANQLSEGLRLRRRLSPPSSSQGDLQGGMGGREVLGVHDLGLGMQPRAGRLGVGLEVLEAERGGDGVFLLDTRTEGVLVSVQDEVPHRDGMVGEARADLAPVLLDKDGHQDRGGNPAV